MVGGPLFDDELEDGLKADPNIYQQDDNPGMATFFKIVAAVVVIMVVLSFVPKEWHEKMGKFFTVGVCLALCVWLLKRPPPGGQGNRISP